MTILKSYKARNLGKLRYLAIVIESEEAYQTLKVIELLQWLEAIVVKRVCLYDTEGVLKKSKEAILNKLKNASEFKVLSSVPTVKLLSGSTILHRKIN
ncbi:Undecaprenyl pyrophosphate synthetase family protein [Prunus dulcis]|uniref:ditrans,polycis-polyprenyl diphosphate synthase [(2E,6E)-farnesyldiphosphate specific] n=1 Tax=Prunus dulcis TaxID=3755 RepID=A0A5H2XJS8_PRUDU|nr:Undecaprenyl pyrophosphate synthetase family protein [Prunus dulcis]